MTSDRYKNYKKDQMGQLFVTAQRYGYNPFDFVPTFMNSNTEEILREAFSVYDGMGYTYLIADAIGGPVECHLLLHNQLTRTSCFGPGISIVRGYS